LVGLLAVPLSIASLLAVPWLTGECVGLLRRAAVADPGSAAPAAGGLPPFLGTLLLAILAVAVGRGVTLFATRWWIIGASRLVEFDVRNHVFAHLQRLDQSYYARARTGDILNRITQDVERARVLAGPIIMYSATTGCMLAVAIPLMLSVSWPLTLLLMVPLSLLTLAVRVIGPRVHSAVFKAQETLSDLSSQAQEDFAGIRVVKSFAQETEEAVRFRDVAKRYLAQNLRAARISSWMHPIVGAVNDLSLIFLLLVGGYFMLDGDIAIEDFVKFAGYQLQLIWPMISIGWVVNQYHRATASIRRLEELLAIEPVIRDPQPARSEAADRLRGDISIRDLEFSYHADGSQPVLRDVSIEVPQGHTVAIIGRTGSGKSTLLETIPRILPVADGTVFIDGIDVNELPLGLLRRSIGFVPQESFLFSRTVRQNIEFGTDVDEGAAAAPSPLVLDAARVARFDKDIDQLPRGYDEMVGERGVTLSGGQKQRASLARALLIRPSILILDDALSAVDTQTEKEILRNLRRATEGLTTLVVAHRVSSILWADRIYVLDEGRIVEEGTHDELLRVDGLYAETYRLQLLSDELEGM